MMFSEKFNLAWNEFENSTSSAFKRLYLDQDFADVTIATKDGQQIKAHRNILSSVSPFFKTILLANPHSHPLIYLKGVKNSTLLSIIKFIYLGQAELYQDDVDDFMNTADDLEISGLCKSNTNEATFDEKHATIKDNINPSFMELQSSEMVFKRESSDGWEASVSTEVVTEDFHDEFYPSNTSMDLYSCTQCEFTTKTRYNLKSHIGYRYQGIRYGCKQCHYQATTTSHLKRHVTTVHKL